ncbi:MAG TPA: toprim domain-containing protein [Acidimicrobiales bacterium]|nr:toprim domain-containing protein [Acidimicrobiales bacterium]
MPSKRDTYTAESFRVLEGLEPVRVRPGMYIGSTTSRGLHHLIWEIVDNSVDEALAGACRRIVVELLDDNVVEVTDDGRGIPVDVHKQTGLSALDIVFTKLHGGGKFGDGGYKVSGGLHGVGAAVTNALSNWLEAEVRRDGYVWSVRYEKGAPVKAVTKGRSLKPGAPTGTTVRWRFDNTIFEPDARYSYNTVEARLREKAFLVKGLEFVLRWPGHPEKRFLSENGIADYVREIDSNGERTAVHPHIVYLATEGDVSVEVALQWTAWTGRTDEAERVHSFANVISTVDGGTHVEGLKAALTSALNRYAFEAGRLKQDKKESFHPKDIWEGLTAAVSVKLAEPQFEGQTKNKLNNSEAKSAVQSFVYSALGDWLRDKAHKKDADAILGRCLEARESRLARGRADTKRKRGVFDESPLPGKLDDCLEMLPVESRELFIVEGDSALGTAGDARDKTYQAVLPIRGKILNVLGASNDRIWKNTEIESILVAMGGKKEAVGKRVVASLEHKDRRYGKIVILTDADTDGAHIANLLLTMLYELFPSLVSEGRIFLARPPLFKINLDAKGEKFVYAYDEVERAQLVRRHNRKGEDVSRFKGLGEMPWEHLKLTCFDPATRKLQQVAIEDVTESTETLNLIMGNGPTAAAKRKSWLEEVGLEVPA